MSASLPTPPRPSVDKENWDPASSDVSSSSPRKSIGWASTKEVFSYAPVSGRSLTAVKKSRAPHKSILKPSRPSSPCAEEKKRDETPLPEDALENSQFLVHPVFVIVGKESSLRELTEAYSILTARIRQSVPPNFFSSTRDTKHALFDPLRREADALSSAIVRDLGRVFLDPFLPPGSPPSTPSKTEKTEKPSLPTPQDSPTPKKGGMNEEQVKYARDLSTVTNASVKFLTMAFQVSAIYNVFSHKQLSAMLTALLAIPLADSIRSPAARKICGLVITALQSQRLSDTILNSAAPRIAFALKRAIEGELGREGKKGATAEALRAIHDLSTYRPGIFIPIFKVYLTTLLEALIIPSYPLRVLAVQALGGFVLGLTHAEEDFDDILREASPVVSELTLRTTDPTHHAQGPFWAMSVLGSLIVLLGPALLKDAQVLAAFRSLVDIGLKSKKRVVRAATSTLWGPLIWVWQKWRVAMNDEADEEEEETVDPSEIEKVKTCFSSMIRMTTHLPIGISFIGALLGGDRKSCRDEDLYMALHEIKGSARMGDESTQRALDLIDRLVNTREEALFYEHWPDHFLGKLVPKPLLSVSPGLLTAEINVPSLTIAVEAIVNAQPSHVDVRPLADEEKYLPGVWTLLQEAWMLCIQQLELSVNDKVPDSLIDIWTGIVRMGLDGLEDDPTVLMEYGAQCAEVLISIFTNIKIDLREEAACQGRANLSSDGAAQQADETDVEGASSAANMRLKLVTVRTFWTHMIDILPTMSLVAAWKPMIRFLTKRQDLLVPSGDAEPSEDEAEALSEWSQFCGQVAALASADITQLLWSHSWDWDEKTSARAWRGYARGWVEDSRGSWREAGNVLGLPFRAGSSWNMEQADFQAWGELLAYAVEAAAKEHVSAPEVLEHVVSCIDDQDIIQLDSTLGVADYLVEMLGKHIENCSGLPEGLIHLVHEILLTAYPPQPRKKTDANWLLRSLSTSISNCPSSFVLELLEKLQDGLCLWISDECAFYSSEEYSREIIPLFQTALCALTPLPPSAQILRSFSGLFSSALRTDAETGLLCSDRAEALTAFADFWNDSCQSLEAPKDGWCDGISRALELAFPTIAANPAQIIDTDQLRGELNKTPEFISLDSGEEGEEEDELDVLPRISTPRRRSASEISLPGSPELSGDRDFSDPFILSTATPKKTTKFADVTDNEPPLPGLFEMFSSSTAAPSCSSSVTRGKRALHNRQSFCNSRARTMSGSSSASSDDAEKENVIPEGHQTRALNGMTRSGRKRSSETAAGTDVDTDMDLESSLLSNKRLRTETCGSDDSADMNVVEGYLRVVGRSPFGAVNANANGIRNTSSYLQTPTKFARTAKPQPQVSNTARRANRKKTTQPSVMVIDDEDDGTDSDDEYIPSSSEAELESEDENSPSGSSSPVMPATPRAARHAEYAVAIKQGSDLASDDVITSSSPTRRIRRMARAERMGKGLVSNIGMKKTKAKLDAAPNHLKWSRTVRA